jgi:hypothetical protein
MSEQKRQVDIIAGILEREGRIDNFRCIHERISLRLGARIADLKALGFEFRTERLPNKNFVYHLTATPKARQIALLTN